MLNPFVRHREAVVVALGQGIAAIHGYDVAGDIAEFGTMTGSTAAAMAYWTAECDAHADQLAASRGHPPRRLFLFDSFDGLPDSPDGSVDASSPHVNDGIWKAGELKGVTPAQLSAMITPYLASDRFEIHAGWFKETLPRLAEDQRFALIHVDSDLYSSAIDVLDFLFGHAMVEPGAYLYFDDWNSNGADPSLGERRAWAEMVEKYDIVASDEGSYGIFARRFVVHDYHGAPTRRRGTMRDDDATGTAAADALPDPSEDAGTSTDLYDHQTASQKYNQATGLADMDPEFVPIYEDCRFYSMTSAERLYAVFQAVKYIQQAAIPGDIVECGVWRGGSMMVAARALQMFEGPERTIRLFDTFEGLPVPSAEDIDLWGNDARNWWPQKRTSDQSSNWARSNLEEVYDNMMSTGYPRERVVYAKGMVEDTLPLHAPDAISLLRLDTDWYASTKHEMEHLFPRLVPNGVLIIDDYGHFQGARQAVDEYLAAHHIPLMLMRIDYTGRIAIKTHG